MTDSSKLKISIVIPMYNVERYIQRCLEACIGQEKVSLGKDYEIVLVDDGSPDHSSEKATTIIMDRAGCRLIKQENKGLGGARNTGLRYARGEYVWFVDSDDWISPMAVRLLLNYINTLKQPDIICFRAIDVKQDKHPVIETGPHDVQLRKGSDLFDEGKLRILAQLQIFRKDFLSSHGLKFLERVMHEDNEFMPRAAFFAETVAEINDILYFIYPNPTSITRSSNPKKSFDLIKVASSLDNFYKTLPPSHFKTSLSKFIAITLNLGFHNILDAEISDRHIFEKSWNKNRYLLFHYIRSKNILYILEGIFLALFRKGIPVYKFFKKIKQCFHAN